MSNYNGIYDILLGNFARFCHTYRLLSVCFYMQSSFRVRAVLSQLKSFFKANKKVIICALVIFLIGIIVGVLSAFGAVSEGFERVARDQMQFASAKVFFISILALLGAYIIFLLAGINNKTILLAILPFFALGFVLGEYATALVARYEVTGIINLLLIYLPFFTCTLICFILCVCALSSPDCSCNGYGLKQSFVSTLKLLGINCIFSLIFFLIIGSVFGVMVVELY